MGDGWTIGAHVLAYSSRCVLGNEDGLLEDPEPGEEPENPATAIGASAGKSL